MPTPDFSKIWASNSPLPEYTFSDADYVTGWDFVGSAPPTKNEFDAWFKLVDTKLNWLYGQLQTTAAKLYPVGSVYISFNPTSPQTLFGGTWVRMKDRVLMASGDTYAPNTTGGSATVTLNVNQLPSHNHSLTTNGSHTHSASSANAGNHNHSVSGTIANAGDHTHTWSGSSASAGNHTHTFTGSSASAGNHSHTFTGSSASAGSHTHTITASTASAGSHTHTRGSMNITGTIDGDDLSAMHGNIGGAFYHVRNYGTDEGIKNSSNVVNGVYGFDASRSWTGETSANGQHTHTIGNTGSGLPLNIMPPYQTVYMWRRTA